MRMLGGSDPFLRRGRLWLPRLRASSSLVPWTLDDIPAEYRVNGGLWEANRQVAENGMVARWPDRWGVRDLSQSVLADRPAVANVNGLPCAYWLDEANTKSLQPPGDFAPVWWIFVLRYRQGIDASWPNEAYSNILSNGEASVHNKRVFGDKSGNMLFQGTSWTQEASINAQPYSPVILPLPLSLLELRGPAIMAAWSIGRWSGLAGRSWRGPIPMAMALGKEPVGDLRSRIQGRIAWDHGLQHRLPPDHPNRNEPPMKEAA